MFLRQFIRYTRALAPFTRLLGANTRVFAPNTRFAPLFTPAFAPNTRALVPDGGVSAPSPGLIPPKPHWYAAKTRLFGASVLIFGAKMTGVATKKRAAAMFTRQKMPVGGKYLPTGCLTAKHWSADASSARIQRVPTRGRGVRAPFHQGLWRRLWPLPAFDLELGERVGK